MSTDFDWGWFLYGQVLGGLFLVPFLIPILTSAIIIRVFGSDARVLKWASLSGR